MEARNSETAWNVRFHQLAEFKLAHGHCNVPQRYAPWLKLANWARQQRSAKRKSKLSAEREAKLNTIGFAWGSGKTRTATSVTEWDIRFNQLVEYEKTNGVACDFKLGRWICMQRHFKKINHMSEEREAKLNSIGFDWTARKRPPDWDLRFRQLLEYKQAAGNCNVSRKFSSNRKLYEWAATQRMSNKKKKMTKERWEKLNSIGFDWRTHRSTDNKNWDVHFRDLLAYLQTHGDCNPPQGDPRDPYLLTRWVSEQRNDYELKRRGEQTSLTPLREAKLDAIGFTWFVASNTEEDAPAAKGAARPEEVRSESKVRSENNGVASPDRIASGKK